MSTPFPPPGAGLAPPGPTYPPPPTAATSSASSGTALLVLAGAVTVIISIFLEWGPEDFFDMSRSAAKIPTQLLWDTIPASLDSFPLMWPLLLAAVTMVLSTMRPKATIVGLIGSLLALAIPLLYVNAIRAVIADPLFADDVGVTDGVGIGTWICMAGAGLGILGSVGRILTGRRGSRSPN